MPPLTDDFNAILREATMNARPTSKRGEIVELPIESLTMVPELQARVRQDPNAIKDYSNRTKDGEIAPPIRVYRMEDSPGRMKGIPVLAPTDGFHRIIAYANAGAKYMTAEVIEGTFAEAVLDAAGANAQHGVRRTTEDCERAVRLILEHVPGAAKWPVNQIAAAAKVNRSVVRRVKLKDAESHPVARQDSDPQPEKITVVRNGREYEMKNPVLTAARKKEEEAAAESGPPPVPHDEYYEGVAPFDEYFDSDNSDRDVISEGDVDILLAAANEETPEVVARLSDSPARIPDVSGNRPLTDEQFLDECRSYKILENSQREAFRRDALAWRAFKAANKPIEALYLEHAGGKVQRAVTPFLAMMFNLLSVQHPREWKTCFGCGGEGCNECKRNGYTVK